LAPLPAESSQWQDASSDIRRAVATVGTASSEWLAARNKVPGVGVIEGLGVFRSAPAQFSLFSFANCNESSYRTAARTLDTMVARFGLSSPQVKRWVEAQDQVFDNCSDDAPQYAGTDDPWYAMVDEWTQARAKVPGVEASTGAFSNGCKGMRFRTAARTLDAMIAKLGASSPQVNQWVEAQDKAFEDCSSSTSGGGEASPAPDLPEPLTDGTPFEQALLQRRLRWRQEDVRGDWRRLIVAMARPRALSGRTHDDKKSNSIGRDQR
jgi:DNA-binding transcriptional regulator YdaS (Cro superfamily)